MDIKHTSQAVNDLLHKGADNKDVVNSFNFNFVETTSVRADPTPLVQVIPSIDFPINSQSDEALQFLRYIESPNPWENTIFYQRQMLRHYELVSFFGRDHPILFIKHPEQGILMISNLYATM